MTPPTLTKRTRSSIKAKDKAMDDLDREIDS